jgi:tetrahydrodipicolinate N-succinyltransferase
VSTPCVGLGETVLLGVGVGVGDGEDEALGVGDDVGFDVGPVVGEGVLVGEAVLLGEGVLLDEGAGEGLGDGEDEALGVGVGVESGDGREELESTYATKTISKQTHTKKKINFLLPIFTHSSRHLIIFYPNFASIRLSIQQMLIGNIYSKSLSSMETHQH